MNKIIYMKLLQQTCNQAAQEHMRPHVQAWIGLDRFDWIIEWVLSVLSI